jgi:hypothetical protein
MTGLVEYLPHITRGPARNTTGRSLRYGFTQYENGHRKPDALSHKFHEEGIMRLLLYLLPFIARYYELIFLWLVLVPCPSRRAHTVSCLRGKSFIGVRGYEGSSLSGEASEKPKSCMKHPIDDAPFQSLALHYLSAIRPTATKKK